jgi:hypothetical protein
MELVTTRLRFADGHTEEVKLTVADAARERYMRPVVVDSDEKTLHWRVVLFTKKRFLVPPGFHGPLESDDVIVERDPLWRLVMERDLGEAAVNRALGQRRKGWRIMSIFEEIAP